jgi:hypothetical protein
MTRPGSAARMRGMKDLKEIGVAIVVTLLVLLFTMEYWAPLLPERFTVRYLLLLATAIAVLLGVGIALNEVIVENVR